MLTLQESRCPDMRLILKERNVKFNPYTIKARNIVATSKTELYRLVRESENKNSGYIGFAESRFGESSKKNVLIESNTDQIDDVCRDL